MLYIKLNYLKTFCQHKKIIFQNYLKLIISERSAQETPGTKLRIDFSAIVVGFDSLHPIVAVAEPTGIDRVPGGGVSADHHAAAEPGGAVRRRGGLFRERVRDTADLLPMVQRSERDPWSVHLDV